MHHGAPIDEVWSKMISISEASKRVKISKSTLLRAIKNGKLSACKNDAGGFEIDAAELSRVYPDAALVHQMKSSEALNSENDALVRQMQSTIDMLREDRDAWREQAQRLALTTPASKLSLFSRLFS